MKLWPAVACATIVGGCAGTPQPTPRAAPAARNGSSAQSTPGAGGASACRWLLANQPWRIPLAKPPLRWAPAEEEQGACSVTTKDLLAKMAGCEQDAGCWRGQMAGHTVVVNAEGPVGSGRIWGITAWVVGVGGFCRQEGTAGWRTLYRFSKELTPLRWIADLDRDGHDELLLWASPLHPEGGDLSGTPLLPMPYILHDRFLVLRPAKARDMYARIATLYRKLLRRAASWDKEELIRNAAALESLASGECDARRKVITSDDGR